MTTNLNRRPGTLPGVNLDCWRRGTKLDIACQDLNSFVIERANYSGLLATIVSKKAASTGAAWRNQLGVSQLYNQRSGPVPQAGSPLWVVDATGSSVARVKKQELSSTSTKRRRRLLAFIQMP
jgi:hypothetical protein